MAWWPNPPEPGGLNPTSKAPKPTDVDISRRPPTLAHQVFVYIAKSPLPGEEFFDEPPRNPL